MIRFLDMRGSTALDSLIGCRLRLFTETWPQYFQCFQSHNLHPLNCVMKWPVQSLTVIVGGCVIIALPCNSTISRGALSEKLSHFDLKSLVEFKFRQWLSFLGQYDSIFLSVLWEKKLKSFWPEKLGRILVPPVT